MKETYYLNKKDILPVMPELHDNAISSITVSDQYIIMVLETDREDKDDAIQYYKPGAKGLVIRCHMTAEDDFTLYKMKHSPRHFSWLIPPRFIMLENKQIETLVKGKYGLSFIALYEYVNSIIFKLYSDTEIQLEALADYVEYEWIY